VEEERAEQNEFLSCSFSSLWCCCELSLELSTEDAKSGTGNTDTIATPEAQTATMQNSSATSVNKSERTGRNNTACFLNAEV